MGDTNALASATRDTSERLVVAITGSPSGGEVVRRAARLADRSGAELIGIHVRRSDGDPHERSGELLVAHRNLLANLGGRYHEVVGDDVAEAIIGFARAEKATHLVLGTTRRARIDELWRGSIVNRTIRQSPDIDVHVVAHGVDSEPSPRPVRTDVRRTGGIPSRRRVAAWIIALFGPAVLTLAFVPFRDDDGLPGALPALMLVVVAVALIGGTGPALFAAAWGFLTGNALLTRPYRTLHITELSSVVGLLSFLAVGVAVAVVGGRLGRRTSEAMRARAQAHALASAAATLADDEPVPALLDRVRTLLGLDAIALVSGAGDVRASAGDVRRLSSTDRISLGDDLALATSWPVADVDDLLVLRAFGDQLAGALHRAELTRGAAKAEKLAEIDRFRTALLRAVSHDLRTPLASIKAAASSLQQTDVDWPAAAQREFLATIVEEGDRLDRIVGNLLDASRLEAGVLSVSIDAVDVGGVVERVLRTIGAPSTVSCCVAPATPLAAADGELLDRIVENLLINAIRFSPDAVEVTVDGDAIAGDGPSGVRVQIVDHGPGVAEAARPTMFDAFGGDGDDTARVGLGLAVAKGLAEAMHARLTPSTTPGGGLTMEITLMRSDDDR